MKPASDWTKQDVLDLIAANAEENLQLEFKAADSLSGSEGKKAEISKDVSAFANSAGGTIIYGISESAGEPKSAAAVDPVKAADFSKERLEQIINSRIQPRINSVAINPVVVSPTESIYVVSIPQSTTAHQASDRRYYKRFNFQSVAMEDYEVRLTLNRNSRAEYSFRVGAVNGHTESSLLKFALQASVENISELPGREVSATLFMPKHFVHNPGDYEVSIAGSRYTRIAGIWLGSQTFSSGTLTSLPPFTPRAIFFERHLAAPPLASTGPLRVFTKIFDQNGSALTVELLLSFPELKLISSQIINQLH